MMQGTHRKFEGGLSRRDFLAQTTLAGAALASADLLVLNSFAASQKAEASASLPWYRRLTRWGQTNITEIDPARYDIAWWRQYWRRTQTQGVIINAGGIVAYYPSRVPLHRPAQYLNGRDLFGDLCRAAHEDGLAVFARMDSNRAHQEFYDAHPDWFAADAAGQPHKAGDLFVTCINSPYYEEHIPAILRELVALYHPEGFTDNSWSGLGRGTICYCRNCQERFHQKTGHSIPREKNWDDPVYRQWIRWNYDRRLEIWDLNNRVTQAAGGKDCIWAGMNSGSISGQSQSFRDYKEICRRAEIIMLDHQSRSDSAGFQHNGEVGKLIHGLLGWEKLVPESMAMYQAGRPTFRLSSKPEPEARLWVVEGMAGGIQPWWHHVGAYHEDRRMYHTIEPLNRWHKDHQQFLINRQPVATVGVVWSQENTDYFGRDDAETLVELPWRGMTQALLRARIPYLPVHADHIDRDSSRFALLILPNLGVLSDSQADSLRRFVEKGGGLIATGQSSLFNSEGNRRPDFALGDLLGTHIPPSRPFPDHATLRKWAGETAHTYLRLAPELRRQMDGPHVESEPPVAMQRHPVLRGFDETDILPFGGVLEPLQVANGAQVLMTFIPSFPIYPPETAWMRQPKTDLPGLVINAASSGGRIAFLPADLDRRFGRDNLPDHGDLLANLVRWVAKDQIPLVVKGPGLIDCHLYQQHSRLILHLVNLTSAGTWRQPVHELIPVGPLRVEIQLPAGIHGKNPRLLVSGKRISTSVSRGWVQFQVPSLLDHEVIILE